MKYHLLFGSQSINVFFFSSFFCCGVPIQFRVYPPPRKIVRIPNTATTVVTNQSGYSIPLRTMNQQCLDFNTKARSRGISLRHRVSSDVQLSRKRSGQSSQTIVPQSGYSLATLATTLVLASNTCNGRLNKSFFFEFDGFQIFLILDFSNVVTSTARIFARSWIACIAGAFLLSLISYLQPESDDILMIHS